MGGGVFHLALPNDGKRANDQHGRCARQDEKHRAPAERRAQRATDNRADIGREPQGDACNTHRRPMAVLGKARHGDRLQQRHEHAGTKRLEHAADDEHREVDRKAVAQRPDEIETVRIQDKGANRQLPLQIRSERNRRAHAEDVDRRKPLAPADFRSQITENNICHGIERRLRHAPEAGAYYHDGEQRVNVAFALIHLLTASHLPLPAPTPCMKDNPEAKSGRKLFCAQEAMVAERKRGVSPSCAENRCRGEKICSYQKNEVSNRTAARSRLFPVQRRLGPKVFRLGAENAHPRQKEAR